jgi:hypothetical protein
MTKRQRLGARARRRREPRFATLSKSWARADVPQNVQIVETEGRDLANTATVRSIVEEMMAVPLDKSILLGFLIGYDPKRSPRITEDQADLYRLQMLLNSQQHGRPFDWLGGGMIARMVRRSIATGGWKPKFKEVISLAAAPAREIPRT